MNLFPKRFPAFCLDLVQDLKGDFTASRSSRHDQVASTLEGMRQRLESLFFQVHATALMIRKSRPSRKGGANDAGRFLRVENPVLKRLVLAAGTAIAVVSFGAVVFLSGDWIWAFSPGRLLFQQAAGVLLVMLVALYSRSHGHGGVRSFFISIVVLALHNQARECCRCGCTAIHGQRGCLLLCEAQRCWGSASPRRVPRRGSGWVHRLPTMPTRFHKQAPGAEQRDSHRCHRRIEVPSGFPMRIGCRSVRSRQGASLERAIPSMRRFRVEILAEKGAELWRRCT